MSIPKAFVALAIALPTVLLVSSCSNVSESAQTSNNVVKPQPSHSKKASKKKEENGDKQNPVTKTPTPQPGSSEKVAGNNTSNRLARNLVNSVSESSTKSGKRKALYLTFDDGPSDYTRRMLSVLDQNGARATFFVLGSMINGHNKIFKKVAREGNAIGNHTWDHKDLTRLSTSSIAREFTQTNKLITRQGVRQPSCMRPPYGATNSTVRRAGSSLGLKQQLWTVDTNDWQRPSVGVLINRITAAHKGQVVLMHDGGGDRSHTVSALTKALPILRARGYVFKTLPGC